VHIKLTLPYHRRAFFCDLHRCRETTQIILLLQEVATFKEAARELSQADALTEIADIVCRQMSMESERLAATKSLETCLVFAKAYAEQPLSTNRAARLETALRQARRACEEQYWAEEVDGTIALTITFWQWCQDTIAGAGRSEGAS